jgi:hypothetical protein
MEALINVMSLIDLNSESIPEGDYLKLCNFMKEVHQDLSKKNAVPRAPFQPIQIPEELVSRRRGIEGTLNHMDPQIRRLRHRMNTLKIRQRVTEGVRRDAVRDAANRLGFRLQSLTIEALRAKGVVIPHAYVFYKEYMERTNEANRALLANLQDTLSELEGRREVLLAEYRDILGQIDEIRSAQ